VYAAPSAQRGGPSASPGYPSVPSRRAECHKRHGFQVKRYGFQTPQREYQQNKKEQFMSNDWMPSSRTEQLTMYRTWIGIMDAATRTAWGIPADQLTALGNLYGDAQELLQKAQEEACQKTIGFLVWEFAQSANSTQSIRGVLRLRSTPGLQTAQSCRKTPRQCVQHIALL
jgi:hypothetical protein